MIKGLDQFKRHFSSFTGDYVLIGGTACALSMEHAGLKFRATKDFDIVLCMELNNKLDSNFAKAIWNFVSIGGYKNKQQSSGKKQLYRFFSPANQAFPEMLELFSRQPEGLPLFDGAHLTPIPIDEEISSLSAILLDPEYYAFICEGKIVLDEICILSPEYLIPVKAKAFLNLSNLIFSGASVDRKDVIKHKNDVIRLYQLLSLEKQIPLFSTVKEDMQMFISILKDSNCDLKALGLRNTSIDELISNLIQVYGLNETKISLSEAVEQSSLT